MLAAGIVFLAYYVMGSRGGSSNFKREGGGGGGLMVHDHSKRKRVGGVCGMEAVARCFFHCIICYCIH